MKRRNATRNALFTSIISLLLCVSMLVGTTFAWFTDSVTSGRNTIAAGNLDIELHNDDGMVTGGTELFKNLQGDLWEPGAVAYENLTVKNVGSLALKYNMSLAVLDETEITYNGETYKFGDAIKVGVVNGHISGSRDTVITSVSNWTSLTDFSLNKNNVKMEVGEADHELAIVLYWEPDTDYEDGNFDNIFNLNNERRGDDQLKLEVGVNLFATQVEHESDTFGPDYDVSAGLGLPVATVSRSAQYENTQINWGEYGAWSPTEGLEANLEAAYTFVCADTAEEAAASEYADWYCDFYVKLDRDLGENQIFLGGYYESFNAWVGFHNGDVTLDANEEIPLLDSVAGSLTYEAVAANVGTFICGVGDVNDALAGATFTVMLRLTNPADENEFYNISTISYKFEKVIDTNEELAAAVAAGGTVELAAGNYTMPGTSGDVTISGDKDTVITVTGTTTGDDVTFDGVTVKGSGYATGMNATNVTYNNATIIGDMCLYQNKVVFNNCTFELNGQYIWTYGAAEVEFNKCTFNTTGKAILIYNEGDGPSNVSVKNCTFNATAGAQAYAIANQNCAAIEIDNTQTSGTGTAHSLTTSGNTYSENFSGEWRIKTYMAGNAVTVNGTKYTQIAIDGKLMTIDADRNVTVQ